MEKPLPTLIGPYKPLGKLGEGGMGVVYKAEDTRRPGRVVALKVILKEFLAASRDSAKRFRREAKILESLRHPNIVSLYEIGVSEGQSYFAMELLEGTTLSSYIGRPYPDVLPLFVQICAGMEYLALRSIVHRDLSPGNIFIVREGRERTPKILDFGIAKDVEGTETLHNLTRTGLLMGKPQYWSPEQLGSLSPGEKIDWRSDVYALGVIFHYVLSARLPFESDTPLGYISAHLSDVPAELKAPESCPPIPDELVSLVRRMLEKGRTDRPQSYREIVAILSRALGQEVSDEDHAPLVPLPRSLPSETSRTGPATGETGDWVERAPSYGTKTGPTRSAFDPTAPLSLEEPPARRLGQTAETMGLGGLTTEKRRLEGKAGPDTGIRAPRGARARLIPWSLAAAALLAAAGGTYLLSRTSPPAGARSVDGAAGPASPPVRETGTLTLNTVPWAYIRSIVEEGTGRKVPVKSDLTTPARLELAPARYAIELASGLGSQTKRVVVEVARGRTAPETVSFVTPEEALKLLD